MPASPVLRHLREAHCVPALEATTPEEAIAEVSRAFVASKAIGEAARKALVKNVLEREAKATTGIGNGIALPHPTAPEDVKGCVKDVLVGVGVSPGGIPFHAVDGAPVHAVFLVAAPSAEQYLAVARLVAGLARDRNWPRLLRKCATAREIHELVEEAWQGARG